MRLTFWRRPPKDPPTTHDYTVRIWGHNYSIMDYQKSGKRLKLAGWGFGITKDDYLLLDNEGTPTRYRVTSIEYVRDPADMWFADVVFDPRKETT